LAIVPIYGDALFRLYSNFEIVLKNGNDTIKDAKDLYVTSERIIKGQNKMIKLIEELYK